MRKALKKVLRLDCCEAGPADSGQANGAADVGGLADARANGTLAIRRLASGRPADSAEQLAALLKAMADPTRLRILATLAADGAALCVCEIEQAFDLSQPTISHHLKVLRDAGLVRGDKRGLWVYYSLAPERLRQAQDVLAALAPTRRGAGVPA